MSTTTSVIQFFTIPSNIISIFSLLVAVIGIIIAWKSWTKSRVYYDVECHFYSAGPGLDNLKAKLRSGNYTVISTFQDEFKNIRVLIGKIKS